jgi:hypothetical protein
MCVHGKIKIKIKIKLFDYMTSISDPGVSVDLIHLVTMSKLLSGHVKIMRCYVARTFCAVIFI